MIVSDMNLFLIMSCAIIILALIILPLIVSYKAEKEKKEDEWEKIKKFGNKINNKNSKK